MQTIYLSGRWLGILAKCKNLNLVVKKFSHSPLKFQKLESTSTKQCKSFKRSLVIKKRITMVFSRHKFQIAAKLHLNFSNHSPTNARNRNESTTNTALKSWFTVWTGSLRHSNATNRSKMYRPRLRNATLERPVELNYFRIMIVPKPIRLPIEITLIWHLLTKSKRILLSIMSNLQRKLLQQTISCATD